MALTLDEVAWLKKEYPSLEVNERRTVIHGTVRFSAAYESSTNLFRKISTTQPTPQEVHYEVEYRICIEDDVEGARITLPSLYIEDSPFSFHGDRHFTGDCACLCGPSEETLAATQNYSFCSYFEKLVIPFLYAQTFYTRNNRWPFPFYNHNTLGALESYFHAGSSQTIVLTLCKLTGVAADWERLMPILILSKLPKGTMRCFCEEGETIRSCHPEAWGGLKKLHHDLHLKKRKDLIAEISKIHKAAQENRQNTKTQLPPPISLINYL